jgi:hypothetical protein
VTTGHTCRSLFTNYRRLTDLINAGRKTGAKVH